MKIELSENDLFLLEGALERAIDDLERYLEGIGNDLEYFESAETLAELKSLPARYAQMRKRCLEAILNHDEQDKYTVVLIYPDYIAKQYGEEYFIEAVEAGSAEEAIPKVQRLAEQANADHHDSRHDFAMVAVFEGDCTAVMIRNFS